MLADDRIKVEAARGPLVDAPFTSGASIYVR